MGGLLELEQQQRETRCWECHERDPASTSKMLLQHLSNTGGEQITEKVILQCKANVQKELALL